MTQWLLCAASTVCICHLLCLVLLEARPVAAWLVAQRCRLQPGDGSQKCVAKARLSDGKTAANSQVSEASAAHSRSRGVIGVASGHLTPDDGAIGAADVSAGTLGKHNVEASDNTSRAALMMKRTRPCSHSARPCQPQCSRCSCSIL